MGEWLLLVRLRTAIQRRAGARAGGGRDLRGFPNDSIFDSFLDSLLFEDNRATEQVLRDHVS